jgi:hypothetical protein
MTDLDAFQRIWAEQDAKLNDMLRLNTNLLQAAALNRARPAFQRLERRQWAAVVIWAMILLALGGFAADHRAEPVLCLSAILAAGYTIWMLSASLRLAIMLRSLDFAAPVACLLDQAAAVRVHRINQTRWGVLSGSAVWAPFFVVVCGALAGRQHHPWAWPDSAMADRRQAFRRQHGPVARGPAPGGRYRRPHAKRSNPGAA